MGRIAPAAVDHADRDKLRARHGRKPAMTPTTGQQGKGRGTSRNACSPNVYGDRGAVCGHRHHRCRRRCHHHQYYCGMSPSLPAPSLSLS
eukprot:7974631-Lingulodinium_polyedra.AAC.1